MSWATELVDLLGGPDGQPRRIDWDGVTNALGRGVPADFRYLSEVIGPCAIDGGIILTAPSTQTPDLDFVDYNRLVIESLLPFQERFAAKGFPFSFGPERGGLVGWGYSGEGSFFWETCGEPDEWRVVVTEVRGSRWLLFDGGTAEFLVKVIRGEVESDFLFNEGVEDVGTGYERFG